MMRYPLLVRIGVIVFTVFFICFVLVVSVAQQVLYVPTLVEQQERRGLSFSERLTELKEWPPAPDHPLYPFFMVRDRIALFSATDRSKASLKLFYAEERLLSSKRLLSRSRYALALTTLTKAEKYVLSAANDVKTLYPDASSKEREELDRAIRFHIDELIAIKPLFNDEERSIIDGLVAQLTVIVPR